MHRLFSRLFVSGTYGNRVCVFDSLGKRVAVLDLSDPSGMGAVDASNADVDSGAEQWAHKSLNCEWHPSEHTVAVGANHSVFCFGKQ